MRPAPQWYQFGSARVARERITLTTLPYFRLERTFFDDRYFKAIGILHYHGHRSGRQHAFSIRLEYPRTFPRIPQRVFDQDKVFVPSPDGHLLRTHEICLTLPERNEFSIGTGQITEEVLGATLIRFHKRRLFDRTGLWPGPAERHGTTAVIDLLIPQGILHDEETTCAWLQQHATTTAGGYQAPSRYAPCPCGSQKTMKFCHEEALRPLFARLSQAADHTLLAAMQAK